MPRIRHIDPFSLPMKVFTYMDTSNTPNHRNNIPSPPTFAGGVKGNLHEFPWVSNYFVALRVCEHDTSP